jgi:anti-sigma B factor antagonist
VETSIGVFSSRSRAEDAVRELVQKRVPEESILFLTRSEVEAKTIGRQFGAVIGGFTGGAVGMSAGVVAASLLLPGIGTVFAIGFGAAALLGLTGAGAGGSLGKVAADNASALRPTPDAKCSEDAAFFREVLQSGRSLVVVRTESKELVQVASEILDRTGLTIQGSTPVPMQVSVRNVEDVAIVDVTGRITLGDGSTALREVIREIIDGGTNRILLNLHAVGYIDSSGLGELVGTYSSVRNQGGQVKLVNPSKRVQDLLQMTRLAMVFDVQQDEASALQSFAKPLAVA